MIWILVNAVFCGGDIVEDEDGTVYCDNCGACLNEEEGCFDTMMLDVGCGCNPLGDINCDLFLEPKFRKKTEFLIPQRIPNFVLCSAEALPFRSESFSLVFCFGVLTHVLNPCRVIKELVRVSSEKILIRVPHRFNKRQPSEQYHYFKCSWFRKLLRLWKLPHIIDVAWYLFIPHEIKVTIWKLAEK